LEVFVKLEERRFVYVFKAAPAFAYIRSDFLIHFNSNSILFSGLKFVNKPSAGAHALEQPLK
jgi:hypothetical protein